MSDLSCHAIVTHDFIEDACGKPAAGFAMPSGQDEVDPWPACAYHINRWGAAPIRDALAAAWGEGYAAAVSDHLIECDGTDGDDTPNPYRTAKENPDA